jgi:hypothetical protein
MTTDFPTEILLLCVSGSLGRKKHIKKLIITTYKKLINNNNSNNNNTKR